MHTPYLSRFLKTSAVYLALAAAPAMALDSGTSTAATATTAATASRASTAANGAAQAALESKAQPSSSMLFARYRAFVGSDAGTRSLIQGLRYRELVTLDGAGSAGGSVSFTPTTRPMGWGSIDRALGLAQTQLASLGITQPTAAQLATALTGGTLVAGDGGPVAVQGVLTLRNQGMGWGKIAHTIGISASGKANSGAASVSNTANARTSTSESEHEATQPRRVRVSIAARNASAAAADEAQVGHGAIVTAGGSIMGGTAAGADSRPGAGIRRATLDGQAGVDGNIDALAHASAQGQANASSMAVVGGGNGNHFGGATGAGFGASGGLHLGPR